MELCAPYGRTEDYLSIDGRGGSATNPSAHEVTRTHVGRCGPELGPDRLGERADRGGCGSKGRTVDPEGGPGPEYTLVGQQGAGGRSMVPGGTRQGVRLLLTQAPRDEVERGMNGSGASAVKAVSTRRQQA